MCTYILYHNPDSVLPFFMAATRDENPLRPTTEPFLWNEEKFFTAAKKLGVPQLNFAEHGMGRYVDAGIVATQDLIGGGTFLGTNKHGLIAVGNNREISYRAPVRRSRGGIVLDALSFSSAEEAAHEMYEKIKFIQARSDAKLPTFNLIIADSKRSFVVTNAKRGDLAMLQTVTKFENVDVFTVGISDPQKGVLSFISGMEINDWPRFPRTGKFMPHLMNLKKPEFGSVESWKEWLEAIRFEPSRVQDFYHDSIAQPNPSHPETAGIGRANWATVATTLVTARSKDGKLEFDWTAIDGPPKLGAMDALKVSSQGNKPIRITLRKDEIRVEDKAAGKNILLVVTGSVAAIKTLGLIQELQAKGHKVQAIVTDSAEKYGFVNRDKIAHATNNEVFHPNDLTFEQGKVQKLVKNKDMILVSPATASVIAQIANESSNLGGFLASVNLPKVIAPAMNVMMWKQPANLRNVRSLIAGEWQFAGPVEGKMACGECGYGRMLPVEAIADLVSNGSQSGFAGLYQNALSPSTNSEIDSKNRPKKILLMAQDGEELTQLPELITQLKQKGYEVVCALSEEAANKIDMETLLGVMPEVEYTIPARKNGQQPTPAHGRRIYSKHYEDDPIGMEHINVPRECGMMVVFPASAKYVAQMAKGESRSFIGDTYLANDKPVMLVPSNSDKPRASDIERLRQDGVKIVNADRSRGSFIENIAEQVVAFAENQKSH